MKKRVTAVVIAALLIALITFGVMNTDKTTAHYVNIITPTSGASSLEVREIAVNGGQIVYFIANRFQINKLKRIVVGIDPTAFVNIIDSAEIMGQGFKALPTE